MPAIVAFFVRQLIIIGVQLGIFAAIDRFVTPLLNDAIAAIAEQFGASEQQAEDILHNEILTTAESLGLTVALSKARLPLALADRLGFTTKGFTKVKVADDLEAKVAQAKAGGGFSASKTIASTDAAATDIAKAKGIIPSKVKAVLLDLGLIIGGPLSVLYVVAQFLDYAAWSGSAFQGTFKAVFAVIGLKADEPMPSSKVLSADVWKKVYNTYKESGAYAINDPYKQVSELFTLENLIDLVDKVAANLQLETGKTSAAAVIGNTQALILMKAATAAPAAGTTTASGAAASSKSTVVAPATTTPSVKVFTGLLASGTLGSQAPFTPRESDLITSADELAADAQQNAASFVAALPGDIVYEVRIVNFVITADGTRRIGQTQRVQTGTYKNGAPKYRVLTNKFAVLDLYYHTTEGRRTKLTSITIGPTDVAQFNPTPSQLASLTGNISASITTTNVGEIKNVVTAQPITTTTPTPSQTPTTPAVTTPTPVQTNNAQQEPATTPTPAPTPTPSPTPPPSSGSSYDFRGANTRVTNGYVYNLPTPSGNFYSGPISSAPAEPMGKLYEFLGLGVASTYTGTATQLARIDQLI